MGPAEGARKVPATARALLKLGRLVPDFGGLPRPFWVLFGSTLVNRVGGFVVVFLAIYLTAVRGLNAAQAGAVISGLLPRGFCCWVNA
jgi:hypothetical protein